MNANLAPSIFLVLAIWGILLKWWSSKQRKLQDRLPETVYSPRKVESTGNSAPKTGIMKGVEPSSESETEACRIYQEMYFKLHHLEDHAHVIPRARDILLSFFSEALHSAHACEGNILAVDRFSPSGLKTFIEREFDEVTIQWQQYLRRREKGGSREMFRDADEAKRWLIEMAPLKYIDGSWLGHIHKITTKFAYRNITKDAWQVLSEELGDGDLGKNHVFVYKELMSKIGVNLLPADAPGFPHQVAVDQLHVWKAALAQLLISLFPQEFLPEILGFNMHFEMLTLNTMLAAKELREVNIDPYYFILHVTIDNGDTGHTRLAVETVVKYLAFVQSTEGDTAAHKAWRRVQTGYILSAFLPSDTVCHKIGLPCVARNPFMLDVVEIFQSKSTAANRLHDDCRARIGGKSLSDWLDPEAFKSRDWQIEFLTRLSNAKPWVYKGNSDRSKLIQKMVWGGSMFGAFTHSEVMTIRNWIDSLSPGSPVHYWHFIGQKQSTFETAFGRSDIRIDQPFFTADPLDEPLGLSYHLAESMEPFTCHLNMDVQQGFVMERLLPLWFTHPCLLESFICVPWMTTTQLGSAVVRFLRAQYGFEPETSGVAGMDEFRRTENVGLVEIGLEMVEDAEQTVPTDLAEVLDRWPSHFAGVMLSLSQRPRKYGRLLLGFAQAFVHLQTTVIGSSLLSSQRKADLHHICNREQDCLDVCIEELQKNENLYGEFQKGYFLAKMEIESCSKGSATVHG